MTSITPPDPQLKGLQARLLDFQHAMRDAGVPVAISDGMDAMRAAGVVDLMDRDVFRESLAATLTSSASHRMAFDTLFDIYFPRTHALPDEDEAPAGSAPGEGDPRDIQDFLADLIDQLMQGDDAALRAMAREAVASYGRVENADGSQSYFAYRVYRNFNLKGLLRRLMGEAGIEDDDDLVSRLMADEFEARLRRFREEIDAEIRRRQVEQRGPEAIAKRAARPLPEDVDFFSITADEQAHMRRAVRPLARKLATRLAVKRKRARDGQLDIRKTLRRALGSGGVPIDPAFRAKKIHRPELVLICDVSGSVAAFAKFTLMFTHALQGQFSRVRSFAFIDTCDEVTHLFADGDFSGGMARMQTEADLVWLDGHSDYGHAFEVFARKFRSALTPRSTVIVLGDARNNYRAANTWALKEMKEHSKRLFWLNPEPAVQWDSGDSVASDYALVCDRMVECRNLNQLASFIETIA
ncbi:carbon monoxide dehydrogenase E protein [Euzebya pacifica]|uniref:Carbon monoxide dehydrogenase E protein n=1 Tax=Euzebya pacifica TaxID=1608957 RepID=A0A346XVN3_9ACTN|nr:VWA domain-containing protein [Euzebya pacifica]AXV06280.1 carbon monoxide dehydrogenase E protein [Euzebya pacifica]